MVNKYDEDLIAAQMEFDAECKHLLMLCKTKRQRNEIKANDLNQYLHKSFTNKITTTEITNVTYYSYIIYFLYYKNEVVYVGQSTNNRGRPYEHKDKEFDKIVIKDIPLDLNLDVIEQYYIHKYKPKYNKCNPISVGNWKSILKFMKLLRVFTI